MTSKPRVYLAGPVADVDDGGHGWRNYVTEEFGTQFEFLNPLDKYDVPAGDVKIVHDEPAGDGEITVDELVTADRVMVEMADAVLVGWERAVSVGTPMEAMLAHEQDTPVVVWDRDQQLRSPWWTYHADIVSARLSRCLDAVDNLTERDIVTDGGTVTACPECDSTQTYERETKTPPWRCGACGHEFDEPVERQPHNHDGNIQPDDGVAVDLTGLVDSEFADIKPGDRLRLSLTGQADYKSAHYVESVRDRTEWDVPFADDWVDADVVFRLGGLHDDKTRHRAVVDSDGTVWLYKINDDGTEESLAEVESIERDGRIAPSSYLKYIVDESTDAPEGDDSWKPLYEAGETA